MKPFRWDLSKTEQLGRLVAGWQEQQWPEQDLSQIRRVCAAVIAASCGGQIVFLGRSPELFFDYLSGQFHGTDFAKRLVLANISFRDLPREFSSFNASQRTAIASFFDDHQLAPRSLPGQPVVLVDYVSSGTTFSTLFNCVVGLSQQQKLDVSAVCRSLNFLGLVARTKNSPNTYRWYQHIDWADQVRREQLRSLSLEPDFIHFLANSEEKVTPSFTRWRWEKADDISRSEANLRALKKSFSLFQLATSKEERQLFKRELNRCRESHTPWFRKMVAAV